MDRIRITNTLFIIAALVALIAAAMSIKVVMFFAVAVMIAASLKGHQWSRKDYRTQARAHTPSRTKVSA